MPGPRTTREEETLNAPDRIPSKLSLRIVLGDRVVTHELPEKGEVVLGRGHDVDVFIDHPSVSRQHARISVDPTSLGVEDLGSINGTRLSGKPLPPKTRIAIQPGDAFELGDVAVMVQRGHVPSAEVRPATAVAVAKSAAMVEALRVVDRVAPGMITVLIQGETGAGKELLAEAIHRKSRRANKPFVRLNCAAVAENLLESEWFGYERGAFTGALKAKPGLLETADGGTVLLDEVGELPINLQAKLLRVLEDRAMLRVGAVRPRSVDVRFVAATNRDLEAEVARGSFRQDLYFRLNGVCIRVPPLRDRREEIEPLALAFVARASAEAGRQRPPSIDREALAWLEAYAWPGNIRELRNVTERAVLLTDGDTVGVGDLPDWLRPAVRPVVARKDAHHSDKGSLRDAVAEVEKQRVIAALAEAGGNQKKAAELLGISRGTLLTRLDAFGISRPRKE